MKPANSLFPITAAVLSEKINAKVFGESQRTITYLSPIDQAGHGSLVYLDSPQYISKLPSHPVTVLVDKEEWIGKVHTYLLVSHAKKVFAELARSVQMRWFHQQGISPLASVDPTAQIAPSAWVGEFSSIGAHVVIGENAKIFSRVVIGEATQIGSFTEIHPGVVIYPGTEIGKRVKIFANAVVGSDGFGLIQAAELMEMPQIGKVVIEDDVRVGAVTTIDKATLGETRIGRGTKIDDHVHIAHNCQLGSEVILCAQVGIAGSSKLGNRVLLAGQVGVGDHVTIGEGARVGAQSGIATHLEGGADYLSSPAVPVNEALRIIRASRKLPELVKFMRKHQDQT